MADVVALSPITPHPSSLAGAADAFLDHADVAATTRRVYRMSMAALVDGLGPARAMADLTGELVDEWFRARYATVAPATWNRELATLRSAIAWWRAAACRPFYRDHFLAQVGTGLRSGELLGLRRRRVFPELQRIEVIEVRYEAGRFGRGFKAEPKSPASVRVVPMSDQVRQAIGRQLPAGARPDELVFPGPGGSNGIPRGARTPLSTHNLRRVYQAAVAAVGEDLAHLDLHGPMTCATPSRPGWRMPVSPLG